MGGAGRGMRQEESRGAQERGVDQLRGALWFDFLLSKEPISSSVTCVCGAVAGWHRTAPCGTASWAAPHQQVGWSGRGAGGPVPGDRSSCSQALPVLQELLRRSRGWRHAGQCQAAPSPCTGSSGAPGLESSSQSPWGVLVLVLVPAALMAVAISLGG